MAVPIVRGGINENGPMSPSEQFFLKASLKEKFKNRNPDTYGNFHIYHNGASWTEDPYEKFYILPMKNLFFVKNFVRK